MGVPPNDWFTMENWKTPLKWMIWGYPNFRKPPYIPILIMESLGVFWGERSLKAFLFLATCFFVFPSNQSRDAGWFGGSIFRQTNPPKVESEQIIQVVICLSIWHNEFLVNPPVMWCYVYTCISFVYANICVGWPQFPPQKSPLLLVSTSIPGKNRRKKRQERRKLQNELNELRSKQLCTEAVEPTNGDFQKWGFSSCRRVGVSRVMGVPQNRWFII